MINCNVCIAIDGPAGVGKTTVGKEIAKKLGYVFLDTGVMYRIVAYLCLKKKVNFHSLSEIKFLMEQIKFEIKSNDDIRCDGTNVIDKNNINSKEVLDIVSDVAKIKYVRIKLADIQRKFVMNNSVVMVGRDVGTFIFPNALVKIFLTASLEVRAKRRYQELINQNISFTEIKENIKKRDFIDKNRSFSPLKKASDAIEIDTSDLSVDDVVNLICKIFEEKMVQKNV